MWRNFIQINGTGRQRSIITALFGYTPLPAIPLIKWPFPLGTSSINQPRNISFQESILDMVLENTVAFRSVSGESFGPNMLLYLINTIVLVVSIYKQKFKQKF